MSLFLSKSPFSSLSWLLSHELGRAGRRSSRGDKGGNIPNLGCGICLFTAWPRNSSAVGLTKAIINRAKRGQSVSSQAPDRPARDSYIPSTSPGQPRPGQARPARSQTLHFLSVRHLALRPRQTQRRGETDEARSRSVLADCFASVARRV